MLTMVIAPAAVGADDWVPPDPQPPVAANETGLTSLPGAIVWTYLGVQDIVGQATADATQHVASVLGGYSDDLAGPFFAAVDGALTGIGDLLGYVFGPDLLDMAGLGDALGDIIGAIAGFFAALAP